MKMNISRWKVGLLALFVATVAYAGTEFIRKDTLHLGSGTTDSKTIEFDTGAGANNPKIRANSSSPELEFANNGVDFLPLGSGSGGEASQNILANSDMELGVGNWTNAGSGTLTEEVADVGNGTKSLNWDAAANLDTLTSDQQTIPKKMYGQKCVAFAYLKGGDANIVMQVIDGALAVQGGPVTLAAEAEYTRTALTFTCPSSGTLALQFLASADAAALKVDDALVGFFHLDLEDHDDVVLTSPEDGQALVYDAASGTWIPGASGDSSFKLQDVTDPNATLKGGDGMLVNGLLLKNYDGAGTLSTDFGADLTVDLDVILGSDPVDNTTYYVYIDLDALGAAITTTDTDQDIYAVEEAQIAILTTAPGDSLTLSTRYIPLGMIHSADAGTVWSGTGAAFAADPKFRPPVANAAVSPRVYTSGEVTPGTVGSVANGQRVLEDSDFPNPGDVAGYELTGDLSVDFGTAAPGAWTQGANTFTGKGFFGEENVLVVDDDISTTATSNTDAHFRPGNGVDWAVALWFKGDLAAGGFLFSSGDSGTLRGTDLLANNNGNFQLRATNQATVQDWQLTADINGINDGDWHHLAGTYDFSAQILRLYIDGQLASELGSVTNTQVFGTAAKIGEQSPDPAPGLYRGFFFINGSTLTASEVNAIYSRRFKNNAQLAGGHILSDDSFPLTTLTDKIAYWVLDADGVNDAGFASADLTNVGTGNFTQEADIFGTASSAFFSPDAQQGLESTNAFFDVSDGTTNFSTGCWVRAEDWEQAGADEYLIYITTSAGSAWSIQLHVGLLQLTNPVNRATASTAGFVNGSWHHVAAVWDGVTHKLYVDGVLSGTSGDAFLTGTFSEFSIGNTGPGAQQSNNTFSNCFFGKFAFTDEDIKKLASSRIDQNQNLAASDQVITIDREREDGDLNNDLPLPGVAHKGVNSLYVDMSGQPAGDVFKIDVMSKQVGGQIVPRSQFAFTWSTAQTAGDKVNAHNLACVPKHVTLEQVNRTAADGTSAPVTPLDTYCRWDATNVTCKNLDLLSIDATHAVTVRASCSDVGAHVGDASATSSGIVNTVDQEFAGTKTLKLAHKSDTSASVMVGNETIDGTDNSVVRRDPDGALRDIEIEATSVKAGRVFTICNTAPTSITREEITVKADDGTVFFRVYEETCGKVMALVDSPSTRTDWQGLTKIVSGWQDGSVGVNENGTSGEGWWRRDGDTFYIKGHMSCGGGCTNATATALSVDYSAAGGGELTTVDSNLKEWSNGSLHHGCGLGWFDLGGGDQSEIHFRCDIDRATMFRGYNSTAITDTETGASDIFTWTIYVPIDGWGTHMDTK